MTNTPFRRPGSPPGGTTLHPGNSSVWDGPNPAPELLELPDDQAPEEPPRSGRRDLALAAALGIVVGVVGTAFALTAGDVARDPVPITPETFPREVMGMRRTDLMARDMDNTEVIARVEEHFEQQLEAYRFAHGADGASMYYVVGGSGVEYTIVNAILAPPLPSTLQTARSAVEVPVLVSYESDDVVCVVWSDTLSFDASTGEPVPIDPDIASGISSCLLADETRNLSLRLTEVGVQRHDVVRGAERMADELRRLHEDLGS